MGALGVPELLVIGAIVMLLFGGKKLGGIMTGMGEGIREFKKAVREGKEAEKELKKDA